MVVRAIDDEGTKTEKNGRTQCRKFLLLRLIRLIPQRLVSHTVFELCRGLVGEMEMTLPPLDEDGIVDT